MKYYKFIFSLILINCLIFNTLIQAQSRTGSTVEQFSIEIMFANPVVNPNVYKAPLKYNKDFALILQMDDETPAINDVVMPYFKGQPPNPGLFFTEGDPASNQPFKAEVSLYSFDETGMDIHNYVTGFLHWDNIINLWAGEFGMVSRGLSSPPGTDNAVEVQRNASYIKRKTKSGTIPDGYDLNVFAIPPNGSSQLAEAKAHNLAVFSSTGATNPVKVETLPAISGIELKRNLITNNLFNDVQNVANQCNASNHYIATYYNHGFGNGEISFDEFKLQMDQIAATYGKAGSDKIWSGSSTEIFEYLRIKELVTVTQSITDNVLTLTFTGNNIPDNFRYYASSIVVLGESNIVEMTVTQPDGLSTYHFSGKNALINMKWNGYVPQDAVSQAENLVTLTETETTQVNGIVAMDYVQMLPDGDTKWALRDRLCALETIVYEPNFCPLGEFLGPDVTLCFGQTIDFQLPSAAGYLWSTGETTQNITYTAMATEKVWARLTQGDGSTLADTVLITVNPLPNLLINPDTIAIFPGDEIILRASGAATYLWSDNSTADSLIVSPSTTTDFTVTGTSALGCSTDATSHIVIAFLGDDISLCFNESIVLSAPIAESYSWSTGEITQNINYVAVQNDTVWAQLTFGNGSTETDTLLITVNPLPEITINPDTLTVNPGDEVILHALGGVSYLWSNDSISDTIAVYPMITTDYFVTGTSALGCKNTANAHIIVEYITDINFTFDTVCFGDTTHLISQVTSNDPVLISEWDMNGDGLFVDEVVGDTVKIVFATADEHLVGLRIKTLSGAIHIIYNKVPVADFPIPSFIYAGTCEGQTVFYWDKSTVQVGKVNNWTWDFGDGSSSNEQNPNYYYTTAELFNVSLIAVSSYGCLDTITQSVNIIPAPTLDLRTTDGTAVASEQTVEMVAGGSVDFEVLSVYDSLEWSGGVKTDVFHVINAGYFSVVVYVNACNNSRFFTVTETGNPPNPTVGIMNLLTPNGDGFNDVWQIQDLAGISPAKVAIYTRAGNLVYSSNNYDNSWKGYYNGNPLPEGSYFYIIEGVTGSVLKGTISIVR